MVTSWEGGGPATNQCFLVHYCRQWNDVNCLFPYMVTYSHTAGLKYTWHCVPQSKGDINPCRSPSTCVHTQCVRLFEGFEEFTHGDAYVQQQPMKPLEYCKAYMLAEKCHLSELPRDPSPRMQECFQNRNKARYANGCGPQFAAGAKCGTCSAQMSLASKFATGLVDIVMEKFFVQGVQLFALKCDCGAVFTYDESQDSTMRFKSGHVVGLEVFYDRVKKHQLHSATHNVMYEDLVQGWRIFGGAVADMRRLLNVDQFRAMFYTFAGLQNTTLGEAYALQECTHPDCRHSPKVLLCDGVAVQISQAFANHNRAAKEDAITKRDKEVAPEFIIRGLVYANLVTIIDPQVRRALQKLCKAVAVTAKAGGAAKAVVYESMPLG